MDDSIVMVESNSDRTLVINIPDLPLQRIWKKRGAKYPFDRKILEQAYYDPAVEYLFKEGLLSTTDKQFLEDVGLMDIETGAVEHEPISDTLMNRMIKLMPLTDLKVEVAKLSQSQIDDLIEYAIVHYNDLKMDRIDYLSKVGHKDLLKSIENYKKAQED